MVVYVACAPGHLAKALVVPHSWPWHEAACTWRRGCLVPIYIRHTLSLGGVGKRMCSTAMGGVGGLWGELLLVLAAPFAADTEEGAIRLYGLGTQTPRQWFS